MKETSSYDETTDTLIVKTTYDPSAVLDANKAAQNAASALGQGRYRGNMAHVGRIDMGDVVRLKNMGYDLLSSDPDEVKRALLYIQSNERFLLTVPGNPFSKQKAVWA